MPKENTMNDSHAAKICLFLVGIIMFIFALLLQSCVSVPLPPTGEDAGKYGYMDVRIQYRPNFDTVISAFRKPNPDLPQPTSSK
jgi:hypothetical protein